MQDGAFKISNKGKVWNVDTTSDIRATPQTLVLTCKRSISSTFKIDNPRNAKHP